MARLPTSVSGDSRWCCGTAPLQLNGMRVAPFAFQPALHLFVCSQMTCSSPLLQPHGQPRLLVVHCHEPRKNLDANASRGSHKVGATVPLPCLTTVMSFSLPGSAHTCGLRRWSGFRDQDEICSTPQALLPTGSAPPIPVLLLALLLHLRAML